jgi:flagellar motor switch protein FliM
MQNEEHTDKVIIEKAAVPFDFRGLKSLKRRDLEIEAALLNYLPFSSQENLVRKSLEEFLSKQFNGNAKIQLEKFEEGRLSEFVNSLPSPCLLAVLGVQPVSSKALVWIDPMLGFSLIDRVLGGTGELPTELKPLTSIEEGVFQYLILKAMREIFEACGESAAVHFRLESIARSRKDLLPFASDAARVILMNFRAQVGNSIGFVVVALPHPLVEGVFLKRGPLEMPERLEEYEYSLHRFDQMGYVRTSVWAEIGSVSLTLAEKNQLEKGDVILFDQTQCKMSASHLTGNVVLRVGEGKGGGFLSQVISPEAPALVKILDYYGGE